MVVETRAVRDERRGAARDTFSTTGRATRSK
jgi:hypothetical protein